MPEPREQCRMVELPSGGTIRVRSEEEPTGESLAALDDIMQAARRLAERKAAERAPDQGAPELWARLEAVRATGTTLREIAQASGVRFSVLFRTCQGRRPDAADRERIEEWLRDRDAAGR